MGLPTIGNLYWEPDRLGELRRVPGHKPRRDIESQYQGKVLFFEVPACSKHIATVSSEDSGLLSRVLFCGHNGYDDA